MEEVRHDIHGEEVGRFGKFLCDFCGREISIADPIRYDIIRMHDMPALEELLELPDGWVLDAARCHACEVGEIAPETDGWEEGLVDLRVNESNGVLSVDPTDCTVIDHSPGDDGFYPPPVPLSVIDDSGHSLSRWGYVKTFVEVTTVDIPVISEYRNALAMIESLDM